MEASIMTDKFAVIREALEKAIELLPSFPRSTTGETAMSDLVERLRNRRVRIYDYATQGAEWHKDEECCEAADEIDRLTAALAKAKIEAWNAAIEAAADLAENRRSYRGQFISLAIRDLRKDAP